MRGLADEAWFVDVDVDTAMARVAARQVSVTTCHGLSVDQNHPWFVS